jgi:hypothetical protein
MNGETMSATAGKPQVASFLDFAAQDTASS